MPIRTRLALVFLIGVFVQAGNVFAQSGAVVNGAVGVAASDGATDLLVSGGIGYRFNRSIGFGIEFTHVPNLDPQGIAYPLALLRVCCGPGDGSFTGHATVFTTNVRVEIPTTLRRIIPFVIGGGGIASTTQKFPIYYAVPLADQASSLGLSVPIPTPGILPGPQNYSTTTLAMALTLGGGASLLLTDHLAIDGDLRALKLLSDNGQTIGRFQVGASYRF
jgi:opacity protein-like surface antigen